MARYNKPKQRLHHEFLYLDHETVLNALSALEAGAVDEIILKTAEAREGGLDASLGVGPVKGGGGKKKQASIQEELVRTRTRFSAFDSWYRALRENDAIGTFEGWDEDVRAELSVGDTVEFEADVRLSPIHKVFTTFLAFASGVNTPGSPFQMSQKQVQEAKKTARMMETWISSKDGKKNLPVYLLPDGVTMPRIVARLDEAYIIGGIGNIEGRFTVVGQIDALLELGQAESVIRIIRDVPPTPKEVEVNTEALSHMIEPSRGFGVEFSTDDLMFTHPTVVIRPIAVYK